MHYICHIKTVPSILKEGILCHDLAARVPHRSIADEEVQGLRADVRVPGGKKLHRYVNLYFNGRNSMMYKLCMNQKRDKICILRVKPEVLDLTGVVVTDRNAATNAVRFSEPVGGLRRIDPEVVFAESWDHPDIVAKQNHKAQMCAEVLVPSTVSADFVMGAYVGSETALSRFRDLIPSLPVSIDNYKFFVRIA